MKKIEPLFGTPINSDKELREKLLIDIMKADEEDELYEGEPAISKYARLRYEKCSDRYMEAENFIMELAEMNWIQRLFSKRKILNFIDSRLKKYDF